ncbi:MAG: TonB-dependent receptor plug domain-containing protein, partial [Planctomycetia bacterium]|nr:TonB-dependent receptor plug domain-containing protein [Planctomycetia bacterium]
TLPGTGGVDFALTASALELSALEVFASRATRNTPVAYSNVSKEDVELRLGSQDLPMVLNVTPSVYATQQGGGAGDARINVRGFNQRNVAIMINGVPVNDMENGWVYWSNWDGIADATSSIQMQRGLSAVNLATPSIGGTMNIITDPAAHERGGSFKQEYGQGSFFKSTLSYNSGLIGDKLALSGTIVRKFADGIIDKTWTDAWAYYFGASYALNDANRLEFYAVGAPQRHGQNLYKQNIAVYDTEFAKGLPDYDQEAFSKFNEAGRYFNQNWSPVSSSYKGKQYWYMYGARTVDRYDPDFINIRENFFHKPQVNLNWYSTLSDALRLSTTFYYSGGSGGGTGTYGSVARVPWVEGEKWYKSSPWMRDWDATIAANKANDDGSKGILRNSINRQWTLGAISKATYKVSDDLTVIAGLDWRTAEIEHAREVRDLLGGDYYRYTKNEFDSPEEQKKKLGDIIAYHNTNTVDWIGGFLQGEYVQPKFSIYGMAGYSMIKYTLTDFFKKAENYSFDKTDNGELYIEADWVSAYQTKGGALYRVTDEIDAYANFGLVQKVPILDNVIDDINIALTKDPLNETYISVEGGVNYRAANGKLTGKLNVYNTQWRDRTLARAVTSGQGSSGDTDIIFLTGLDQDHKGVELEGAFQPIDLFRVDLAASYGDWRFVDDAKGTYKDRVNNTSTDYEYSVKDLKVGDMPQTMVAIGATFFPIDGLSLQGIVNWYDRNYADWDPAGREKVEGKEADRGQSWEAPSYYKIDFHGTYNLPFDLNGITFQAFVHIFNVLDEVFIQDALDNSQYNSWDKDHDADDAEVFFGLPRSFNVGINVNLP